MEAAVITAVGIDVSKSKSTVAARRPGGEIVLRPFEVHHTNSDLKKLASTLKKLGGDIRIVMEHLGRKKGTSLSWCLLLAEMVGILPRAKQQPAGLIACGLRAAALFSSAPSWPQKRHQPKPVPFVGGDGGIRTHVPG